MTDELLVNEKKTSFFFPLRGNTIFGFQFINDQRLFPRKKGDTFETGFFIIDPKYCAWKLKALREKIHFCVRENLQPMREN